MIYILRFERTLGNLNSPYGQAHYYVGYCEDDRLPERLAEHRCGAGAAITRAAARQGISFDLVATMPGDRARERQIKRQKSTPRLVARLAKLSPDELHTRGITRYEFITTVTLNRGANAGLRA
jgi:predicted GIY-YIG superfamily endonuclease